MIASPTAIPTPMAIFFQAFMIPVTVRVIYLPAWPSLTGQVLPHSALTTDRSGCFGLGDGHTSSVTILAPRKFPIRNRRSGPSPLRVASDSDCPGTKHYSPGDLNFGSHDLAPGSGNSPQPAPLLRYTVVDRLRTWFLQVLGARLNLAFTGRTGLR